MKRALFSLIIFLSSINIFADNNPGVKLLFASGDQIIIQLEEKPLFSFVEEDICITTSERILRCNSDELIKFTYINVPTSSIENSETGSVKIKILEDGIFASNLKPNSNFFVFTQDGKLICSSTINEHGIVNAHFPVQKGVVYIIKSSTVNLKMYNK